MRTHEEFDEDEGVRRPAQAGRNFLQILWQRKWLVLFGVVVGLTMGSISYSQSDPVYRSSAQVLVIKKRSDAAPVAGAVDTAASYLEDFVSTHIVLLKSPVVIEQAVKRGKLNELKTFEGGGNPTGAISSGLGAVRDLQGGGGAKPSGIINLTFQGRYPDETAKVIESVIDSYSAFLETAYQTVSKDTQGLIEKARDILRNDLAAQEKKYREFREGGPLLWKGKDGLNQHASRFTEFEAKRSSLLIRKAELEGRLRVVEDAKKTGQLDVTLLFPPGETAKDSAAKSGAKTAEELLFPLLLEEEELLMDYGVDHPKVRSLRLKIKRTRELIERGDVRASVDMSPQQREQLVSRYTRSMQQELAQLEVSRKSIDELMESELKFAKEMSKFELTDEWHRTEISRTQQLYDQTIKRLQEINLVREFGGYDAKVISPAGTGRYVSPNLFRTLAIATVLGLLAGLGLAYLADMTDRSFRSAEEIRLRLGLPIMGHIPFVRVDAKRTNRAGAIAGQEDFSPALCVYHRPTSMEAEAFRALRTAVYFGVQGEGHKVIQITSPNMGDGKSTVMANLAISMAQSGKRVVLVDADCRRPRVHRLLGLLPTAAGLTSVMSGEVPLGDAVMETKVNNLFVLPCGTRPPNPAELLTSPRFERVLVDLRDQFDYVLVDTPPVLAVTDPCVVATRVDGVLLTVRIAKNGRPAAERAKDLLTGLGVNLLGVIVNGIGGDGASGYGYRYYSYDEYRYNYVSDDNAPVNPELNGKHSVGVS